MSTSSPAASCAHLAFAAALLALSPACGGKGSSTPSAPTAATPTTTTTTLPAAPPVSGPTLPRSCQGLPPGTGVGSGCRKGDSQFFGRVRAAVDVARGGSFRDPHSGQTIDMVDGRGRIMAARAYVQSIVDQLDAQGLCAVFDGEEIYVRDGGGFNENFDVITASGDSWANYVVTCTPPLPMPTPPPVPATKRDPDCPLPPSAAYFCTRQGAVLDHEVYGAQDDLIAEDRARATPLIFEFRDRISGTEYGFRLINESLYVSEMLKKLKARGMCAAHDGEEFNVKRSSSNVLSENYDLTRQDGFAIRIYGATCRDADF